MEMSKVVSHSTLRYLGRLYQSVSNASLSVSKRSLVKQSVRFCGFHAREVSPSVTHVIKDDHKRCVQISWEDGKTSEYPFVWMRDNCQCPSCFHPVSQARLLLMPDLDPEITPDNLKLLGNKNISVHWPDGHRSVFQGEWLKERSFNDEDLKERDKALKQDLTFWDAETITTALQGETYANLVSSEVALYNWLSDLQKYGLALIKDTPGQGSLMELANKIAFPKITHYGDKFVVKTKVDPSNLAYTGARLGLHTDLPYYDYQPGIQFLHCIKQCTGEGGENQFADGFHVAHTLKEEYPEHFHTLSAVPLDHWDYGVDYTNFNKILREPVFRLNAKGNVCQIRYNNQVRDSFIRAKPETVQKIYEALKAFDDLCYSPQFKLEIKLNARETIVFDNRRVLHGRNGFSTSTTSERILEGLYIDWDEMLSTLRFLRKRLNRND